jgi:hypothetical protein
MQFDKIPCNRPLFIMLLLSSYFIGRDYCSKILNFAKLHFGSPDRTTRKNDNELIFNFLLLLKISGLQN